MAAASAVYGASAQRGRNNAGAAVAARLREQLQDVSLTADQAGFVTPPPRRKAAGGPGDGGDGGEGGDGESPPSVGMEERGPEDRGSC